MNRWLVPMLSVLVIALALSQYYQFRVTRDFHRDLVRELGALREEVQSTRAENRRLQKEIDTLRGRDLGAVVEDASEALVTGWNSMLDALESELKKAEEALRERRESSGGEAGKKPGDAGREENDNG